MNSPNNLDIKGNLRINPLAELLCELSQIRLNGSLRLSCETHKIVVYFDAGEVVFAVSNARGHRLFESLLQAEKITKEQLAAIADFTNDLALKEHLLKNKLMEKAEIDALFSRQVFGILQSALNWQAGEWTFSPLVRVKGDIRFQVNLRNLLIEYARNLSVEDAARKFKNLDESLSVASAMPADICLSPRESFVFSRFETAALTIEEIQNLSGLPIAATFQILYALWLGGLINRKNHNRAFSERHISAILSAKLTVKKEEIKPPVQPPTIKSEAALPVEDEETTKESAAAEKEFTLDDYLNRIENAASFYDMFALAPDSATAEIKQNYFALAKRFHPDLFYKETDVNLHRRVQHAFTELAHAYETLKHEKSRGVYDFKMRKELAEIKNRQESGLTVEQDNSQKQAEQAAENFEQGFSLLMDENYEAAVTFLMRAVHFAKDNARYHAYYGKALSTDLKQRHKAEAELQTAVKLDAGNADYRLMLAEFFIQVGLFKRAEGELNRLLQIFPSNRDARTMLDSLPKK